MQAQLMQAKAQLAQTMIDSSRSAENHWPYNTGGMGSFQTYPTYSNSISPQSSICSLESNIDHCSNGIGGNGMHELMRGGDDISFQAYTKKSPSQSDLEELQALAFRMMKN